MSLSEENRKNNNMSIVCQQERKITAFLSFVCNLFDNQVKLIENFEVD